MFNKDLGLNYLTSEFYQRSRLHGSYITLLKVLADSLDVRFQQMIGLSFSQETFEDVCESSPFFPTLQYALNNDVITKRELIILNYALHKVSGLYPGARKILDGEHFITRDDIVAQTIFGVLVYKNLIDEKELLDSLSPEKRQLLNYVFSNRECFVIMDRKILSFKDMISFESLSELRTAIGVYYEEIVPAPDSIEIRTENSVERSMFCSC